MESVLMQLQAMRIDAHRQCNECYKTKVTLGIQLEENEERLQYFRGAIAALDRMEKVIIQKQTDGISDSSDSETSPGMRLPTDFTGQAMDT